MTTSEELINLTGKLENAFECPICVSAYLVSKKILQCTNGHDICESCRLKVRDCPQCSANFTGTRNFGLEKLLELMENLKTAKKNEQSKNNENTNENSENKRKKDITSGPEQGKGFFKCRFEKCESKEPICRLLNHSRTFHKDFLIEAGREECDNQRYLHQFDAIMETPLSKIYQISKFGLYFFRTDIQKDKKENVTNFYAWLQVASSNHYAKTIRYTITITYENEKGGKIKYSYDDIPYSVKKSPEKIIKLKNCLHIQFKKKPNLAQSMEVTLKLTPNKGTMFHLTSKHQRIKMYKV